MVHLLQLLLGRVQGVRRRVQLVRLKALIRQRDLEDLIILLHTQRHQTHQLESQTSIGVFIKKNHLTSGTASLSAWALAASVVTVRFTNAVFEKTFWRRGAARPVLNARENMAACVVEGKMGRERK